MGTRAVRAGAHSCGLVLLLMVSSCSGTRQITTEPPRSGVRDAQQDETGRARAPLDVVFSVGSSSLPDAVQSLRFRVAHVWLRQVDTTWIRIPADVNQFEVAANQRPSKLVLSTLVPAASYDSIGVSLEDAFVLFDANAGGPLTLARNEPIRLPLAVELVEGQAQKVEIVFEPNPSLYADAQCRWYFVPVITSLTTTP